ncbi:hypothetical protein ABK040_001634 [Willaertia magna]
MEVFSISRDATSLISIPEPIKTIKSGRAHAIILTINNELYIYGSNFERQLGNKGQSVKYVTKFEKLENYEFGEIKLLECGSHSTFIINQLNELYFTGKFKTLNTNGFVQLKSGVVDDIIKDDSIIKDIKLIRFNMNNNLYFVTENIIYIIDLKLQNNEYFVKEKISTTVKDLQCTDKQTILLDKYGMLFNLEDNNNLTFINLPFKVKQLTSYSTGFLILNNYGEVYGMGENSVGQLGFDSKNKYYNNFTKLDIPENTIITNIFIPIDGSYNIIITKDNKMYATGEDIANHFEITDQSHCKVLSPNDDNFLLFDIDYVDRYTEINLHLKKYFYFILTFSFCHCAMSDWPFLMDENNCDNSVLGVHCFKKLQNKQLFDINIICKI